MSDLTSPSLMTPLSRSDRLHSSWREAVEDAWTEEIDIGLREQLALDACLLVCEHGAALRSLISAGLESSALALLRVQHEALLRAAWILFSASDDDVRALGAPHTAETLKQANRLPLTHMLLDAVEKSEAPPALKKGLREFRDRSWAGLNSYAHAGLLASGRVAGDHPHSHLVQAIQVSNAHSYAANMLSAQIAGSAESIGRINVIAVSLPGCMLRVEPQQDQCQTTTRG